MNLKSIAFAVGAFVALSTAGAQAAIIPYPGAGTENPLNYTFTASAAGDVTAYFSGSTASFVSELGLLINGAPTGVTGLNTSTSSVGDSLVLGTASAGDTLTFFINVLSTGDTFYSDESLNTDGVNHVWSTAYSGDSFVPAGVYVAFEDLNGGGDFNYQDLTFVFTNVTSAVPEPSTWAMMLIGFAGLGFATWRRRRSLTA